MQRSDHQCEFLYIDRSSGLLPEHAIHSLFLSPYLIRPYALARSRSLTLPGHESHDEVRGECVVVYLCTVASARTDVES